MKTTTKQKPQILSKTKETYEQHQAHPSSTHTPKAPAAITEQKQLSKLLTCCLFFHPSWHRQIVSWFYLDNSLFVCLFVFLGGLRKKHTYLSQGLLPIHVVSMSAHGEAWGSLLLLLTLAGSH